ncbi:hypothetical protein OHC33_006592 [Knufia fluminis]|uniref:F-box domain-containing protein n=1 Tax=Knufia fluminis TaxID=191047 RepID=A0AAN8I3D8_9EURO|nr:hypothetical protein OHC33_006592 [Knufia fluminis]
MSESVSLVPTGINELPDELLTKILSFVPYSAEQHATLTDVSTRFERIANSGSYRMQALRAQFPEITALHDIRTVTMLEFSGIAMVSSKLETLSQTLCPDDANETRRYMLLTGLHILEHLLNISHIMNLDSNQRMTLARWSMEHTLCGLARYSVRYAIAQLYHAFYPLGSAIAPFRTVAARVSQVSPELLPLTEVLKVRAFESTVLSMPNLRSVTQLVRQKHDTTVILETLKRGTPLVLSMVNGTPTNGVLSGPDFMSENRRLDWAKGYLWRPLSKEDSLVSIDSLPNFTHKAPYSEVVGSFVEEYWTSLALEIHFDDDPLKSLHPDTPLISLKLLGESLLLKAQNIGLCGGPEELQLPCSLENMLDKLNGLDAAS